MQGRRQGEVDVAAAMVVVVDRARLAVLIRHVDQQAVALVRRFGLIVVVVMIVVDRRGGRVGDARELKAVLDAVLRIHDAMELQRDHDGHGKAGAELAEQSRQYRSPDLRPILGDPDSRNDPIVARV
jgi:hypothetical protein